ncbi:unnamed protein product, partial [Rotaria socialis]
GYACKIVCNSVCDTSATAPGGQNADALQAVQLMLPTELLQPIGQREQR